MRAIEIIREYLGEPYVITTIDCEEVIYRNLGNGFEFVVTGIKSIDCSCSLCVWSKSPQELVGIYKNIQGRKNLKDILGYYAAKYQNLTDQILIEREE